MTKTPLVRELVKVVRANFLPALGLQCVAAFLLWAYYFWPAAHALLNQLAVLKAQSGYGFAFLASALAGAILPFALQPLQRGDHRRIVFGALPFVTVYWGVRGCFVDAFYQAQTLLWGDNALPLTIVIKIFCDLAIISPLVLTPAIITMFAYVDSGFNFSRLRSSFHGGIVNWWLRDVWPLQRLAWLVWLPAVAVIYALPSGLQFATQSIIQCFWALILVILTDQSTKSAPQTAG